MKSYGRPFLLYLFGQGFSNLGDSFRFIAITILLYKLTGSGISAATGLLFSVLTNLLLSPFAGAAGDRFNEKHLLAAIDIIKAAVIMVFTFKVELTGIYIMLVFTSALDTVCSPSRRKFILRLAGKRGVLDANSLLTGVSGAAFLTGPLLAGILTDAYGTMPALYISSACCIVSAVLTLMIRVKSGPSARKAGEGFINDIFAGFDYCRKVPAVREVLGASVVTGFCAIAVNMAFYPFAFDMLKVTAKGWSLMISIYYGTNLIALPVMKALEKGKRQPGFSFFYAGLFITGIIWLLYTFIYDLPPVLLLQFIEGTILAVCGILLSSRMQVVSDSRFLARVSGVGDVMSGGARLLAMGAAMVVMQMISFRLIFIMNASIILLFSFWRLSCENSN